VLFNSYVFILAYLPVVFAGFLVALRIDQRAAVAWLFVGSLFFYGWWDSRYLLLLLPSIAFNYCVGLCLTRSDFRQPVRRAWLVIGLSCNLLALTFFKYTDFLIGSVNSVAGTALPQPPIILPLGISFFTFTQIAFLVDSYAGKARELSPVRYGLFVSYFPHLIAGPVLHHSEMMPQFADAKAMRFSYENVAVGLTIFVIGLFKKVVIADNASIWVGPVFSAVEPPTLLESWFGALAYAVQIYFDFSGYSDMAIGLSRLFGVVLPLNFHSPYKARNIIEFWRCWHMTLSRFLRDYLYIPLGGNRKGGARRYMNLLATMLLGGLWHGAGWTYVIWGGLHGIFLVLNHAWHGARSRLGLTASWGSAGGFAARLLTFVCVIFAWVFFRASNFQAGVTIAGGMLGLNGVVLPEHVGMLFGPAGPWLQYAGVKFSSSPLLDGFGEAFVAAALAIAFWAPNTQQMLRDWRPALVLPRDDRMGPFRLAWSPGAAWTAAIAVLAILATVNISEHSEFLYFQF
jgi:D-alanyl-lipoteichoic acid acyltransferase DltB (MBOAT superfamily)